MDIEKIIDDLSIEELIGQMMCLPVGEGYDPKKVEEKFKKYKPGSIFVEFKNPANLTKLYSEMANRISPLPVLVASDVEFGPGCAVRDETYLPQAMAWGACDDEKLVEEAGELTAAICRETGVNWTFSPNLDISINKDSASVGFRSVSDVPKPVLRIMSAHTRGMRKNGHLVCACKHFPGGGVDDRNEHFVTTINTLSKEEWDNTYGMVYKGMIDQGVESIMVGHVALPAYDSAEIIEGNARPPVFSHDIMTDLLRNKLGFKGCIVCDALGMIGASAYLPLNRMAIEYIKAGGDILLYPEENDFDYILGAVKSGEISVERIKESVRRIIKMKEKARLFEDQSLVVKQGQADKKRMWNVAQDIADKSVKIVKNDGRLPVKLGKGDKVLMVNLEGEFPFSKKNYSEQMEKTLKERGCDVEILINPGHHEIQERLDKFDTILVNCFAESLDSGSSRKLGWNQIMVFWRGYIFQHPKMVFISYSDPYKLREVPYVKCYINAFSQVPVTQNAVVKLLAGEIEEKAKNPVSLQGFFEREID